MNRFRNIVLIIQGLLILCAFCGCDKTFAKDTLSEQKNCITVKRILQEVVETSKEDNLDAAVYYDDDMFKENCIKLYGIEYSELADGGIMYASGEGLADEISVIRMKNDKSQTALKAMKNRIEKRVQDFTGYKPQEVGKIENALTFETDGYTVLVISDNAENLKTRIEKIIEKSEAF